MSKWRFSPQLSDQVETEITQRDQFNNDQVDISETIVREAVQNSLDAAINDPANIKVTFRWIDAEKGIDKQFFKKLFEGQLIHAQAAEINTQELDFEKPQALVIEDFGTRGLTGSINVKDDENFSDFWRRHGKSHKTGKHRGRWGLGKLVYSTTSRIGVFFGITCRATQPEQYLMGQTVLNLRKVEGHQYPPHAFFSDLENEDDIYKKIPVPIRDQEFVNQFAKNFNLERNQNPGLSIVIPFPNLTFNPDKMIGVAIENYFYPLITGQLVLQFDDIEINKNNVRQLAKEYAENRFHEIDILFDFIEEIYRAEQGNLLPIKPSWTDDGKLDEQDFEPAVLEDIRIKFSRGDLVGVYLPVTVKLKNGQDKKSGFSVYIKRPENLVKGLDLYVRGGLTLPGEAKFRERRGLGALIAEEEAICSMLGDAENAAHTQWTSNTEKLRKNYRNSQPQITIIKKSVLQLYDLLAGVTEDRDEDALQDFFWFEEPDRDITKRHKKPKKEKLIPEFERSKPLFSIHQIKGGFSVANSDALTEEMLPREIRVHVAYAVDRGNPYKKYSPHDFSVGKNGGIRLTSENPPKVLSARENKWTFEVDKLPFKFNATGFDENRDLKISIS